MGTSTNYLGSPNWAPVKKETTRAGGESNVTPDRTASIVNGIVDQMVKDPNLGLGPQLPPQRTGPGAGTGTSSGAGTRGDGSSGGGGSGNGGVRSRRGSARSVARGIGSFLADVGSKGFLGALADRGLTDISGKTPDEVAFALADLLGGPASLIEQTALRDALMTLVLHWAEGTKQIDTLAANVSAAAMNIQGALHEFFGHYIFEVFKTVGYQGVLATHGFDKAETMAGQIREFIDAKVTSLESTRPISSVDWNGAAGATIVNGIVADTIEVFGEVQS